MYLVVASTCLTASSLLIWVASRAQRSCETVGCEYAPSLRNRDAGVLGQFWQIDTKIWMLVEAQLGIDKASRHRPRKLRACRRLAKKKWRHKTEIRGSRVALNCLNKEFTN